jgi:hypothetical protein
MTLVKATFSDIKNKFEISDSSFDTAVENKDSAFNRMIGKVAFLKKKEGGSIQVMLDFDGKSISSSNTVSPRDYDNNRLTDNLKNHIVLESSQIWPFKTSFNTSQR